MTRSEHVIRIVSSSAATLIAALFVLGYHSIKYHNNVYHGRMPIPYCLQWVHAAAHWMFLVPLVVLVLGVLCLKRSLMVTVVISVAWLFALAWPLLCIWAWELPFLLL